MIHRILFQLLCLLTVGTLSAQSDGDYRSAASGNWNQLATWERFDGMSMTWVPASTTPVAANGVISIRDPHQVTVTANVTVDDVIVDQGGMLRISGGNLTIANGTGTDLLVNGVLEMLSNSLIVQSSGNAEISVDGVMTINTAGTATCNGVIVNQGTLNWLSGRISVLNVFTNSGTMLISCDTSIVSGGGGSFVNSGTITKSSSGKTRTTLTFSNSGLMQINAGIWSSEGQFNNLPGSQFQGGGLFTHSSNFSLGTSVEFPVGMYLTNMGNITNSGSLTINNDFVMRNNIGVTGTLTVNGNMTWKNGILNKPFTVQPGRTLTLDSSATKTYNALLTNEGVINWLEGNFDSGDQLVNNGQFIIACDATFANDGGGNMLNNQTMMKTTGGTTTFTITALTNSGTGMIMGTGTIAFADLTNNGTIAPGLSPGILTLNTAQPFSANSTLMVEMAGGGGPGQPNGHDQLLRTGNLTLNGTLEVVETDSIPNGSYPIISLQSGTISGNFTTLNLPPFTTHQVTSTQVLLLKETPIITCPADVVTNTDPGICGAVVAGLEPEITPPGAQYQYVLSGATSGSGSGSASGLTFNVGETDVTYALQADPDVHCAFTIDVEDTEPPVAACPTNITVTAEPGESEAIVNYMVGISDNCPGANLEQTSGIPSGALFPLGTTGNTFLLTDAAGNTGSCGFSVTVLENGAAFGGLIAMNTTGALPDSSSILDISSDSRGLLIPRMTMAQREAISGPATGLMVFQTDSLAGLYYNAGTPADPDWDLQGTTQNSWSTTGNSGTSPLANFIGTTDGAPLVFKLNNTLAGKWEYLQGNYLIGSLSGQSLSGGSNNTGMGQAALKSNTSGSFNQAFGYLAMENNTVGHDNVAVGHFALRYNTAGWHNVSVGGGALQSNTTGNQNTAAGYLALSANTSGVNNVATGAFALQSNTEGQYNTAVGLAAMSANTLGDDNASLGHFSLEDNTTGIRNAASGGGALQHNVNGNYNTACGYIALRNNLSGSDNTALGASSLSGNTSGNWNTAVGAYADVGSANLTNTTAIGNRAFVTASDCMVLGSINGVNGAGADTRVGIGTTSPDRKLEVAGNGKQTVLITSDDAADAAIEFKLAGSGDDWRIIDSLGFLYIGRSDNDLSSVSEVVRFSSAFLSPAVDNGSSLGSASRRWTEVYAVNGTIQTSDIRDKEGIEKLNYGLYQVMRLNPVSYRWKKAEIDQSKTHLGFIAQEVNEIVPEVVVDHGWKEAQQSGDRTWEELDRLGVNYAELIPVLVKAIQEQQAQIAHLAEMDQQQRAEIEALKLLLEHGATGMR